MSWGSRLLLLLVGACASADRLAPDELELRDLLGIAPEVAMAWEPDQRAGARHVLEAGMHDAAASVQAPFDHNIAATLAAIDAGRALHHEGALGVMHLDLAGGDMHATARSASLAPRATSPIELRLVAWPDRGWGQLPARGLDVLATIATDAGHRDGPLVVTPAPQLAAIAGYVPATATEPAWLVVNPIVLAALEPATSPTPASPTPAAIITARTAPDTAGNPYSFYTSVAACASAQRTRCEACLPSATCTPVTHGGDGNAECTQFAADANDGYAAICIDLAVVIDSVDSCIAASAPACPRDRHATESLASLDNNADFVTDTTCAAALDTCLADIFGGATLRPAARTRAATAPRTAISAMAAATADHATAAGPTREATAAAAIAAAAAAIAAATAVVAAAAATAVAAAVTAAAIAAATAAAAVATAAAVAAIVAAAAATAMRPAITRATAVGRRQR
jgi:hypothetical protein